MTNKKMLVGTLVCVLALVQAQMVFGEENNPHEIKFMECFVKSDMTGMEQAIKDGGYRIDTSALLASVFNNYYTLALSVSKPDNKWVFPEFILNRNKQLLLPVVRMLIQAGAVSNEHNEYVYKARNSLVGNFNIWADTGPHMTSGEWALLLKAGIQVYNYLLDAGADPKPIGGFAIQEDNIALLRSAIEHGMNVNETIYWQYKPYKNIELPLTIAALKGQYAIVKLLVEAGAKVNQKELNRTPAEHAKEKGEIDIYNYLIAHGADDPGAPRVAQAAPSSPSSSNSNNYSYTPPPASSNSSSSSSSRNVGAEIAQSLQKAFTPPLDGGTYALSGTQAKMKLAGIGQSGIISYTTKDGKNGTGSYSISGNNMTIQMEGYTFVYSITSRTSFSGSGERWVRTGY